MVVTGKCICGDSQWHILIINVDVLRDFPPIPMNFVTLMIILAKIYANIYNYDLNAIVINSYIELSTIEQSTHSFNYSWEYITFFNR